MLVKPLYKLAASNELGDNQFMDKKTIDWIDSCSFGNGPLYPLILSEEDFLNIENLVPCHEYFLNTDVFDSIHGIRHILRVIVNTTMLCKLLKIDASNYLVAASIHDLRRLNDRIDPGHGVRAWEWFDDNRQKMPIHTMLMNDNDIVRYSTVFHDTNYDDIPESILSKFKPHIDILKAADALDRFRQPNSQWFPNIDYIDLKEAQKLLSLSKRLTVCSEKLALSGMGSSLSVITAARELLS